MAKENQQHNLKNMIGLSNVFKELKNGCKHLEQQFINHLN
jgi:hypothetical protein